MGIAADEATEPVSPTVASVAPAMVSKEEESSAATAGTRIRDGIDNIPILADRGIGLHRPGTEEETNTAPSTTGVAAQAHIADLAKATAFGTALPRMFFSSFSTTWIPSMSTGCAKSFPVWDSRRISMIFVTVVIKSRLCVARPWMRE